MIRILQCVSNMDRAGIETMLMNYYRNINREEIQFDFLVNKSKKGDYDDEIKSLGGKIYVTPGLNPLKFFKYQKFMKQFFKEHPEYKVIHCHNEAMGFYALKAATDCKIPVRIAHSHNTDIKKDYKYLIKQFCKLHILKVSNLQYACSKAAGKYLFKKDVPVLHNAIDVNKFKYNKEVRKQIRSQYNLKNKFVVGHIGRFEPQKNHMFLLEIFKEISTKIPNSVLLLIGTGVLEEEIKSKIRELKLEKKVILTGSIPNVNEFYQAMDVFLLPSLYEGLPVVGIEAQAAGLKCFMSSTITDEVCITNNVVFHDINKSPKSWANIIIKNAKYEREDMSQQVIDSGYDISSETLKLMELYTKLHKTGV